MTLRVAESDEKYKRRLFFDGARRSAKMEFEPPAAFRADSS
jgi:hypothetical protein